MSSLQGANCIETSSTDSEHSTVEQVYGKEVTVEPPSSSLHGEQHTGTKGPEPDVLLLKHVKATYRLRFPPHSIDRGLLTVGDLRQRAAEKTGTTNPKRIRLPYKRKMLNNDTRSCKEEGLKTQSVVLRTVSEEPRRKSTPADLSGSNLDRQPPNLTELLDMDPAREQLDAAVSHFRSEIKPLYDEFVTNPTSRSRIAGSRVRKTAQDNLGGVSYCE